MIFDFFKLSRALDEGSQKFDFAYQRYLLHKKQAIIQHNRIYQRTLEKKMLNEGINEPDVGKNDINSIKYWFKFNMSQQDLIFAEIHLWFISLDNVRKMLSTILKIKELNRHWNKYSQLEKKLTHYTAARNAFEHFDERLPGGRKSDKVREVKEKNAGPRKIFGGIRDNKYLFGDMEWDLSHEAFNNILNELSDFENDIENEIEILQKESET